LAIKKLYLFFTIEKQKMVDYFEFKKQIVLNCGSIQQFVR